MLTSIVGTNWGDEGKGRMVDLLSEEYDIVVRYQGENFICVYSVRECLILLITDGKRPAQKFQICPKVGYRNLTQSRYMCLSE